MGLIWLVLMLYFFNFIFILRLPSFLFFKKKRNKKNRQKKIRMSSEDDTPEKEAPKFCLSHSVKPWPAGNFDFSTQDLLVDRAENKLGEIVLILKPYGPDDVKNKKYVIYLHHVNEAVEKYEKLNNQNSSTLKK